MGLDLDLDLGGPSTAPGTLESTQTLAPSVKLLPWLTRADP